MAELTPGEQASTEGGEREELPADVKVFIVGQLATFRTPTEVLKAVQKEFGLTLTRQRVAFYDPTTAAGAKLDPDLQALFHATRARYQNDVEAVPIANQAVRLNLLWEAVQANRTNPRALGPLLEQAAKEVGGAFTNRRQHEVSGPDGGAIPVALLDALQKVYGDDAGGGTGSESGTG